ncbi:hypothetical protein CC79DRAFT_1400330 [Sarocladium strictum]
MASHEAAAPITRLPAELLAEILRECESPRDFLNLALACKSLLRQAEAALHRHRVAHRRFRYVSDLDPSCFPDLVRSVVLCQDDFVAIYARSIDIWVPRLSWDEWRQCEVDERGMRMQGEVLDGVKFNEHEIKQLLALTRDWVGEEELSAAHEELENGADGLLKFLVIASCPRLEMLKFIRRNDVLHKSSQMWLEKSIRHILSGGSEWPPGLQSLRDAAFGVDAGILDEHIQIVDVDLRPDKDACLSLRAILQLPALKTLHYRTECYLGDPSAEDSQSGLSPASSNVETLYLDNVTGTSHGFLYELSKAPKKLETLAIRTHHLRGAFDNPDTFLEMLRESQPQHLKRLMFYNPSGLSGYRCNAYRPEDIQDLGNLTMWYQNAGDMCLQALYDCEGDSPNREEVVKTYEDYIMPRVEVLVMNGRVDQFVDDKAAAWSYFDDAIETTIWRHGGAGPLKAIFIPAPNEGELDLQAQQDDPSTDLPVTYPRAIEAAEECNVDLYVFGRGKGTDQTRHRLDFPLLVTKWDIPTGPDYKKRVEQGFVKFNPLSGEWQHVSEPGNGLYAETQGI